MTWITNLLSLVCSVKNKEQDLHFFFTFVQRTTGKRDEALKMSLGEYGLTKDHCQLSPVFSKIALGENLEQQNTLEIDHILIEKHLIVTNYS